jgi:hypothetical protein
MKRIWGIIFISITSIAWGQKRPIPVNFDSDTNNSCGHVSLGSGFEKSGMVQYVARPKIIESKWDGRQLTIKIFVVSDCCPPDFLGYVEQSDTLNLYYGDKKSLPNKNGQPQEIEICMCGHNGCCFEFEYRIKGLKRNTNYLVAISDVIGIGRITPYPIGYTDSKDKSVHYSRACTSFNVCLEDQIDEAVLQYKKLGPLYDSLITLRNNESPNQRDMVDHIKKVWIQYFSYREAIYDEFIRTKIDKTLYDSKINEFESRVWNELKLLEPKLNITNAYLSGGALSEPISELKILKN